MQHPGFKAHGLSKPRGCGGFGINVGNLSLCFFDCNETIDIIVYFYHLPPRGVCTLIIRILLAELGVSVREQPTLSMCLSVRNQDERPVSRYRLHLLANQYSSWGVQIFLLGGGHRPSSMQGHLVWWVNNVGVREAYKVFYSTFRPYRMLNLTHSLPAFLRASSFRPSFISNIEYRSSSLRAK